MGEREGVKNRMVKFFIISDYTVNAGKKGGRGVGGRGRPKRVLLPQC
jgi:hypothetical protein